MKWEYKVVILALGMCFVLSGASEARPLRHKPKPSPPPTAAQADPEPTAKTVHYGAKDVITINTKV